MWIEVPIVCHTETSATYKDLGIEQSDGYEDRKGSINTNHISTYYPNEDGKKTLVSLIDGSDLTISLTYQEFHAKI